MYEPVRTYKPRRGRFSAGHAAALERLAAYTVVVDGQPLDTAAVFGRRAPLALEIGSGMGEATAAWAADRPDLDVLAVEVHTPGLGALLRRVEDAGLTNVRVAEGDALVVLRDMLGPESLAEVRALFPDPWPKSRHAKRRLVTAAFADLVADRLGAGGVLHVATDWPPYAEQVVAVLSGHPAYRTVVGERRGRPVTRFEQQGLDAGRAPTDVVATRREGRPGPLSG